ncbi:MAG TPA: hypothetical protein VMF30_17310, partial [Pirellulales bacterium]|nr:hypothetical protein [Pirellulales bacterium]
GQVAWWLGRVDEHDRQWAEAAQVFRLVPADNPQHAAAVESAARAYQRVFDRERSAGKLDPHAVADAIEWLRQVMVDAHNRPDQAALERQAALWAARFSINDLAGGVPDAEAMLKQTLAASADAPAEWRGEANLLLVTALVERHRYDEAAAMLGNVGAGSPSDLLTLLEKVAAAAAQAAPGQRRSLAQLERQTLATLDALKPRFSAAEERRLDLVRLRALIDDGQQKAALALAEKLAAKYPDEGAVQEDYARLLTQSNEQPLLRTALGRWREIAGRSRAGTPRWFRAQLGMAQTQLALGNRAQARAVVKIVEAGYPQFGPADGKADPQLRAAFLDVLARTEKP